MSVAIVRLPGDKVSALCLCIRARDAPAVSVVFSTRLLPARPFTSPTHPTPCSWLLTDGSKDPRCFLIPAAPPPNAPSCHSPRKGRGKPQTSCSPRFCRSGGANGRPPINGSVGKRKQTTCPVRLGAANGEKEKSKAVAFDRAFPGLPNSRLKADTRIQCSC